jgi:hypothetical protein
MCCAGIGLCCVRRGGCRREGHGASVVLRVVRDVRRPPGAGGDHVSTERAVAPAVQLTFGPKRPPDNVIRDAREGQNVIASYCLFSGGNDSTVVAHRCKDDYEALVHIDTSTAVPGVRDFCEEFAAWIGKPLSILTTSSFVYRDIVFALDGFPGPAQHHRCYSRLKERQVEALVRDTKIGYSRDSRVLLITGLRRAESARRSQRKEITRNGAQLWCNPLIDWTARDMWDYREMHMKDAPMSDVAALLHRSGECNCGAYAAPGEREELQALYPEWFDSTIGALEREASAAGLASCVWGGRPNRDAVVSEDEFMCSDCQLRIDDVVQAAIT